MILARHRFAPPNEVMQRLVNHDRKVYMLDRSCFSSFKVEVAKVIKQEAGADPLAKNVRRDHYVVQSRQLFCAMMKKYGTKLSLTGIGRMIGRDHATVYQAIIRVNGLYDVDIEFRALYNRIDSKVKNLK